MRVWMNTNKAQAETFVNVDLDLRIYTDSVVIKSFNGGADFVIDNTIVGTLNKYLTLDLNTLDISSTNDSTKPIIGVFLPFDTQTHPILMVRDTSFEDMNISGVEVAGGSYGNLSRAIQPFLNLTLGGNTFSTRYVEHLISGTYTLTSFDNLIFQSEFDSGVASSTLTVTRVSDGVNMFNSGTNEIDLTQPGSYVVTVGTVDYSNIVDLPIKRPHIPWFTHKLTVM